MISCIICGKPTRQRIWFEAQTGGKPFEVFGVCVANSPCHHACARRHGQDLAEEGAEGMKWLAKSIQARRRAAAK
jgi:hypothetical protein